MEGDPIEGVTQLIAREEECTNILYVYIYIYTYI